MESMDYPKAKSATKTVFMRLARNKIQKSKNIRYCIVGRRNTGEIKSGCSAWSILCYMRDFQHFCMFGSDLDKRGLNH